MSATLTGNTYRDTDQNTRVLLDEWSRYYPGEVIDAKDASGENVNKLPSMVEVIIGEYIYFFVTALVGRVFANGPGDWGSISSQVITDSGHPWWCNG